MERLLARWALAIQEYDFTIQHRKGLVHRNADALSRKDYSDPEHTAATTQLPLLTEDLRQQQLTDSVIHEIHEAHPRNNSTTPRWHKFPFSVKTALVSVCTMAWYVTNILHHLA